MAKLCFCTIVYGFKLTLFLKRLKTGTETGLDISPQMSVDTATKKPLPPVVLQQELKMAGRPEDLRGQLGR